MKNKSRDKSVRRMAAGATPAVDAHGHRRSLVHFKFPDNGWWKASVDCVNLWVEELVAAGDSVTVVVHLYPLWWMHRDEANKRMADAGFVKIGYERFTGPASSLREFSEQYS